MGETWILAMASGSLGAWTVQQLIVHGPKWENVTPMLIGISTLISAIASYQNHRQVRLHAGERRKEERERSEWEHRRVAATVACSTSEPGTVAVSVIPAAKDA